jgi:hypothetical protein
MAVPSLPERRLLRAAGLELVAAFSYGLADHGKTCMSLLWRTGPMQYRVASVADCPTLAALNAQLIQDEGHRNPMSMLN